MKIRMLWSIVVLAVLAFATGFAPVALAQGYDEVVSSGPTLQPASTVTAYWTPERMAAATPMPLPIAIPGAIVDEAAAAPSGPMVVANSGQPGDVPTEQVIPQPALSPEPTAGTYPYVFTGYQLFPNVHALYAQFPYRLIGKVFFTIPGQGNFVCSGSIVNSTNYSMVWTAGHCVYTPGVGFHTNFVFVPARYTGVNTYQTWTANQLQTLNGWTNGLFEYDHGAAYMNRGGPGGTHLLGELGWLGFVANAPRQSHWHALGYPAAGFDGEHMEVCATPWFTDDQPTGTPGTDPPTIGYGCHMTGGSSGGPLVLDLSGGGGSTNLINGNVSYHYIGQLDRQYSPYFSTGAINLRNFINGLPIP